MTTIDSLLKSVAPSPQRPDPGVVDGDLARGRAAIRRMRRRRGGSAALAAVLVAASVSAVALSGGANSPVHASNPSAAVPAQPRSSHTASVPERAQVRLVAYTGAQLPGFTVSRVPHGWHLSSSISDALCITPDGSTNNDPDDWAGKLAVLTSSTAQTGLEPGTPVTVNGRAGTVSRQDGILILDYTAASGFGVDIQAPQALGWTGADIVHFAEGVTVTTNAVHGNG